MVRETIEQQCDIPIPKREGGREAKESPSKFKIHYDKVSRAGNNSGAWVIFPFSEMSAYICTGVVLLACWCLKFWMSSYHSFCLWPFQSSWHCFCWYKFSKSCGTPVYWDTTQQESSRDLSWVIPSSFLFVHRWMRGSKSHIPNLFSIKIVQQHLCLGFSPLEHTLLRTKSLILVSMAIWVG